MLSALIRQALLAPERNAHPPRLLRTLLLQPRLFDLASAYMQYRDEPRRKRVAEERAALQDEHFLKAFDHNAGVTGRKPLVTTRRMEVYYRILAMPPRDMSAEKLLIVGPRNVHELLMAYLYGFDPAPIWWTG
jgi:hypothetical protein